MVNTMGRQLCPWRLWMSIGKRLEPLKSPMLEQMGAQKRLCLLGMHTLEWASGRMLGAMERGFHTGACLLWDSWSNRGPALEQPVPEELQSEKYSRKIELLEKVCFRHFDLTHSPLDERTSTEVCMKKLQRQVLWDGISRNTILTLEALKHATPRHWFVFGFDGRFSVCGWQVSFPSCRCVKLMTSLSPADLWPYDWY